MSKMQLDLFKNILTFLITSLYTKSCVLGCNQNRYGVGCLRECSNKCKDQHCDAFNGSCIHGCADPNALTLDCIGKNFMNGIKSNHFEDTKICKMHRRNTKIKICS